MNKDVIIGINPFLVTFRCNLKCKLCSTGTPYKEKQIDFPLERLKQAIDRQFTFIKYINKFSLGGGEPTLHKDLPAFIEYLATNYRDRFEIIEVFTNGVAIPSDELISCCAKYKNLMFFLIDDYGHISKNAAKVSEILTQNGIKNIVRCYHDEDAYCGGWLDQGFFT